MAVVSGCTGLVEKPVLVDTATDFKNINVLRCQPIVNGAKPNTADPAPKLAFEAIDPKAQIQYQTCLHRERAVASIDESNRIGNRSEWRDIPLMGAAAAIAGILLFGKRDADNKLVNSAQDAIAIGAFGAATFASFANYLSPEKARDVLRKSARGHFCMATQGDYLLTVWDNIERRDEAGSLNAAITQLEARVAELAILAADARGEGYGEAIDVLAAAKTAIRLHRTQLVYAKAAPTILEDVSFNFGLSLMQQTDRTAVDVDQLIRTITEQSRSIAEFEQSTDGAPGAPGEEPSKKTETLTKGIGNLAIRQTRPTLAKLVYDVRRASANLTTDLPNIKPMVLGFEKCASVALVGGEPRATMIDFVAAD